MNPRAVFGLLAPLSLGLAIFAGTGCVLLLFPEPGDHKPPPPPPPAPAPQASVEANYSWSALYGDNWVAYDSLSTIPPIDESRRWWPKTDSRAMLLGTRDPEAVRLRFSPLPGPGQGGFEWDGIINYRGATGEVLRPPEVQESCSVPDFAILAPPPGADRVPAIDNAPFVQVQEGAAREAFEARLIFPDPLDHLFVAFSRRDGLPPPSVAATAPAEGARVDWWARTGERLQITFTFDQEMVVETPFPMFVVRHTLGVPIEPELAGRQLAIRFTGPIPAGPHQVTLNPPGFAPLLRSISGRVLAPFTLNFEAG
ncbi:MAG: hypothetical protein HY719_03665 [Planctomycetes bacterium]|nr:hypothetical protein [Planctomycetota bacterium]